MKMFYSAYTCQGNTGDLLITKYQIEEYAKYGEVYVDCHGMPDNFCQVIFDSNSKNIKDFEKEYGYSYRSINVLKVLYTLNKEHFTHFCGNPGPKVSLKRPLMKLLFKLSGAILPELILNSHIKKFAIGVDVKYAQNNAFSRLNHWYFSRYDVIGLRSMTNYYSIRQSFKNVKYVPDMAFLYPFLNTNTFSDEKKRIAFSFRKVDNRDALVKDLLGITRAATAKGFSMEVIYQVEEDKPFCEQILQKIKCQSISPVIRQIDFYSLDVYRNYDLVVSNRLHVLLMAAMNGALPYALISHDNKENKIKDLFDTAFSNSLVNYIEKYENEAFDTVIDHLMEMKTVLIQDVNKQRQLCVKAFEELF